VSQKKYVRHQIFVVTSSNTDQLSKFFSWHILQELCSKAAINHLKLLTLAYKFLLISALYFLVLNIASNFLII